ncbi:MAG: 3-dehydroquinate synthase [Myxococcaceae bacterium]|nr:3-dehydroquinate synthase [Myxococcaceae bacterium]
MKGPGAYQPLNDTWGRFDALVKTLPENTAVLLDARVAQLHPHVRRALRQRTVVAMRAGEGAKSLSSLGRLAGALKALPRNGTLLVVGGGTLGDLGTVAAHVHKRGLKLIHAPSTYLAAVDSSVGGKGALNAAGAKNVLGVFHYAEACWLCPELFTTLSPAQAREGLAEAVKMAACLGAKRFAAFEKSLELSVSAVKSARQCKAKVCAVDPYEQTGKRTVLNFGHTLGHVLEAASGFRLRHGEAVGLGMTCALDVGRHAGVTPEAVAQRVEALLKRLGFHRAALAKAMKTVSRARLQSTLAADKKSVSAQALRMVLLTRVGGWVVKPLARREIEALLPAWQQGRRP